MTMAGQRGRKAGRISGRVQERAAQTAPSAGRHAAPTPPLEVALGVVGAAILTFVVAYLIISALEGTGSGFPEIRVDRGAAQRQGQHWLLPIEATNVGKAPVAQLRIVAHLQPDGESSESGEMVIDYLAPGSSQPGGFFFSTEPREGTLSIRPVSYVEP
jgi:uncharacterized protein (TIGR02588 family)